MEERLAKIKKYFETSQGAVANPRYAAFALSLLEKANPFFLDVITSFNREGEVTLRWPIDIKKCDHLYVEILDHDDYDSDEESREPDSFDILIMHRGCFDFSSSNKKKVENLFAAFEKSTSFEELADYFDSKSRGLMEEP